MNSLGKEYIIKELKNIGYEVFNLDEKIIKTNSLINIKDSNGYCYLSKYNYVIHTKGILSKFYMTNPYSLQNIRLWCKSNNKPFELLSDIYEGNKKKLKWLCLKDNCGEVFEMSWNDIIGGHGCGYCKGTKVGLSNCLATKYPNLAKEWHPIKNGNLSPHNTTCNPHKKSWWICSTCGREWETRISDRVNHNSGCPYCAWILATKQYNLLVHNPELCKEWNYELNKKDPSEYLPYSNKKVYWTCKDCGNIWKINISNRSAGNNCPECAGSKVEKKIKKYIENHNIVYESYKTFGDLFGVGNGKLSYDFYLPDYNLLIEFQGVFHDGSGNASSIQTSEELLKQQEHDLRKREYAKLHNIKLLEIWHWEINDIETILEKVLNKNITQE